MQIAGCSTLLQSKYQMYTDGLLHSAAFDYHVQVLAGDAMPDGGDGRSPALQSRALCRRDRSGHLARDRFYNVTSGVIFGGIALRFLAGFVSTKMNGTPPPFHPTTQAIPAAVPGARQSIAAAPTTLCLSYGQNVTLTGTIQRVKAYGPPGFGETPKRDAHETHYELVLPAPICTLTNNNGDDPSLSGISRMQINFGEGYAAPLGHQVRITSSLEAATTGHHHTPVMIDTNPQSVAIIP
jgi:hypothetical protein